MRNGEAASGPRVGLHCAALPPCLPQAKHGLKLSAPWSQSQTQSETAHSEEGRVLVAHREVLL
jgi:hypothetical protein